MTRRTDQPVLDIIANVHRQPAQGNTSPPNRWPVLLIGKLTGSDLGGIFKS
jgi:hypothetical protein